MVDFIKAMISDKAKTVWDFITRVVLILMLGVVAIMNIDLNRSVNMLSMSVKKLNLQLEGLHYDTKKGFTVQDLKRELTSVMLELELNTIQKLNYESYERAGTITADQRVWLRELPGKISNGEDRRKELQAQLRELGVPFSEIQTRGK